VRRVEDGRGDDGGIEGRRETPPVTHPNATPKTQAKLAEEAERYEDMVQNVKALAELNVQLNVEVRGAPDELASWLGDCAMSRGDE